MVKTYPHHYIDGQWVATAKPRLLDVINPATERVIAQVAMGGQVEVDGATAAARRAFDGYAMSSREERIDLLERIIAVYRRREEELAVAVSREMGCPIKLARQAQVPLGLQHLEAMLAVLRDFPFEQILGKTLVIREPVGVCALITPWNWPLNQLCCKVAPALAAGCTMILKPSERSPLSGILFAEVMDEAGVPAGVFNLISGDGPGVGEALSRHPLVDMVSFTGSTRGGISVARNAADTVKRVAQELGGKSANIILDSADFDTAVFNGALRCFSNSGQTCSAPTRMLVPAHRLEAAADSARRAAEKVRLGDPADTTTTMGPVVCKSQYERVQACIARGLEEGAELVAGGLGRPPALEEGYFVQPTVFSKVDNTMTIAREEIFGPVLSIIPYTDEEEAIAIANDTPYGLAAYVQGEAQAAGRVARRLRAGLVNINDGNLDAMAPFGGYKQSGNGREWGRFGLEEFLEAKSLPGYQAG